MKAIEKSAVMAKMFDQAKLIRRSARAAERQETVEKQEIARQEMMVEKQQILARQAREKGYLKSKCTQLFEIAKKQAEAAERPHLSQITKLERLVEDLKTGAAAEPIITPAMVLTTAANPNAELVSARTVSKYAMFKSAASNPRLKIQPPAQMPQKQNRTIKLSSRK